MKRRLAQENLRILPGLLAERSGGGFAGSPDVPASALGPRIVHSLHAGCRVECETSGLSGEVIGAAIEVHRDKGPGLIESIFDQFPRDRSQKWYCAAHSPWRESALNRFVAFCSTPFR
jgi:hypothetical protein